MPNLFLWSLFVFTPLLSYTSFASEQKSVEEGGSSRPERKLTRVLSSPRPLTVDINPNKGSLIKGFYQKQRESSSTTLQCPQNLTNEQVSNIVNARYNQSRGSTEAVQVSEKLLVTVKVATETALHNLRAAITPEVTAEFLYLLQSKYLGSTVSQLNKVEEARGALAKYTLKQGDQPLKYRPADISDDFVEAILILSLTYSSL